ncbi:ArsB/NhaD family transporter [bacterium]|nr:ArsB/NhaD family transporter [bacterium]
MYAVTAVATIFVATYFFIVTERINRTTIALAGALAVLLLPGLGLTQEEAVGFIDFNTLGLLVGMMLIVAVLKRTGVFRFLALHVARQGRGRIFLIYAGFGIMTAVASAFIDNVTTVLMIVPVIYLISDLLGKSAIPFLVMEIMMANIGGMATMIGDPPNILIGSRAIVPVTGEHLAFVDFMVHLGPLAIICLVVALVYLRVWGGRSFFARPPESKMATLEGVDPSQAIKDRPLLTRSLSVLGLVLVGFLFHHQLGLQPATVAMAGAAVLLVVTRIDPQEVLVDVEWPVLFFFIGLFVLVGALDRVGIVGFLAERFVALSDDPRMLMLGLLWMTALLGAFLSAVPTVTVLIPLVQMVVNHFADAGAPELAFGFWWALAAGACLGGNATVVGAAANMAVLGMSQKEREPLRFAEFARVGVPVTAICLTIASAYVLLRYT